MSNIIPKCTRIQTIILSSFLALLLSTCTNNSKKNTHNPPLELTGKTFINYSNGKPLNIISFGKGTYIYVNGEMENRECGTFHKYGDQYITQCERIIWPAGGMEEADSTRFILTVINDTTLTYTQRISYRKEKWDTIQLDPYYYHLKENYSSGISQCK